MGFSAEEVVAQTPKINPVIHTTTMEIIKDLFIYYVLRNGQIFDTWLY